MIRDNTVCFTGHRIIPPADKNSLLPDLYKTVFGLIRGGYDTFICGGAIGFDTYAAECVIAMKKKFPEAGIRLVLMLPCRNQTEKWAGDDSLRRYKSILGDADDVKYAENFYTDECMLKRNRMMVDASRVCVAYSTGKRGGSAYTVKYAEKCGVEVKNLAPDEQIHIEMS